MSKKDALTRAAADLLWERGYTGTSPAMILERAQAGQGSMYHHFSGKAELAVAAMVQMSDQLRSRTEDALAGEGPAVARINAFLDLERDPLAGCRIGRLTQDHDVVNDDTLRAPAAEFFTWVEGRLAAVLADGVRTGELRPDTHPDVMASLIIAAVQGGYTLARAHQDPAAFRQAIDGVKQVVANLAADAGRG
ncbi:TetR/AcrR family transcriptional regulator [Streptomyces sp. BPTC-684]|uniref:TetR/AcrR family transcriptional regulator n=1 Tax=Streptomyces sp. BPTC-684 TaxID=3043734 RepID=UPI0024B1C4CF|nr:TetR/AcrR family transcriptional regulator [Streptomyces sp. BPTC-684]WHM37867.1 TetR/AcrR family transcriptional regulator [Streptomyces sp. BPTC-684]